MAFRPSVRVRLQLRIDEFSDTEGIRRTLEREPPKGAAFGVSELAAQDVASGLDGNFQRRQQLESVRASLSPPQLARERAQLDQERAALQKRQGSGESQTQPHSLTVDQDSDRNVVFQVLPEMVKVRRNGIKDADTAKITIDFRDVPVDPRVVRACLVSVAMGTVEADEWEAGQQGKRREDGTLRSLVDREPGQELKFNSSTVFVGFVDEWLANFSEDGDTIRLECRDVGALLRDEPLPAGVGIDLTLPIDQGVRELINRFPSSRGLDVRYGTPTDPDDPLNTFAPETAPVPADTLSPVQKSRKGRAARGKKRGKKQKVWDHVLDVCQRLGLVPMLRGFTLFLMQPRVLFASFAGARKMVLGRNIQTLTFARKLGGVTSDTIEVRCPDPRIGRTRWARYPVLDGEPSSGILGKTGSPQPVVSRASRVSPNGTADERIQVYTVRGVNDLARLEEVARSTFEEIGRQEIEGSLSTEDIESFETRVQGDLLLLQPGEPVTIQVAPVGDEDSPVPAGNLQRLQGQSVALRAAYLESLGIAPQTAQKLAVAQEQVELVSTFRAGHVNLEWDQDDGVHLDFDFHNFVIAREAPEAREERPRPETLTDAAKLGGA